MHYTMYCLLGIARGRQQRMTLQVAVGIIGRPLRWDGRTSF